MYKLIVRKPDGYRYRCFMNFDGDRITAKDETNPLTLDMATYYKDNITAFIKRDDSPNYKGCIVQMVAV